MKPDALESAVSQLLAVERAERMRLAELARYAAGSLDDAARARVDGHLAACEQCRRDLDDLRLLDDVAPPSSARPPAVGATVLQFPARKIIPTVVLLGAIAAAALMWLGSPANSPLVANHHDGRAPTAHAAPTGPALLAKGAWSMHVGVRRGESTFRATPGDILRSGDQLGLFYSAARGGHLMVLYVDDAGEVVRIVPARESRSLAVSAGAELPLPDSAVVGPGEGCEYIVGVFAREPFGFDRARQVTRTCLDSLGGEGSCRSSELQYEATDVIVHAVRRGRPRADHDGSAP